MHIEIDKTSLELRKLTIPLSEGGRRPEEVAKNREDLALIGIALKTGSHILRNHPSQNKSMLDYASDHADRIAKTDTDFTNEDREAVIGRQELSIAMAGLSFLSRTDNLDLESVRTSDRTREQKRDSIRIRKSLSKAAREAIKNIDAQVAEARNRLQGR